MHAIIGTGISACVFSTLVSSSHLFDKARFPGGRISTKPFDSDYYCDLGSILFNDEVMLQKNGILKNFSFKNWLEDKGIGYKKAKIELPFPLYYPLGGMHSIPKALIEGKNISYSHELVSFSKTNNQKFHLRFLDGSEMTMDHITITAPIPQTLNFFPPGDERDAWESFLKPYNHYRKTLVACGYWEDPGEEFLLQINKLNSASYLDRGETHEFMSIESFKTDANRTGFVFMIQFSKEFSEQNFADWRNPDRSPTENCKNAFKRGFQIFLENQNLNWTKENLEPNEWRIHNWRYAQAESSLLEKDGILDLDHPGMKFYEELVNQTNIRVIGDWLFGSRLDRITAGIVHSGIEKMGGSHG